MKDGFKVAIEWTEAGARTLHEEEHKETEERDYLLAFPSAIARAVEAVIPRSAATLAEAITELEDRDEEFFPDAFFNLRKACLDYLEAWRSFDAGLVNGETP